MNGKLIVFEGLDGSGKKTQSDNLLRYMKEKGINVRKVEFPDYSSPSASLINMYLAGEFGTAPGDVNPYAASSFYAVDRYASYKKCWADFYSEGGIIIADRYTTSNAIHQCSKLQEDQWDSFLDWLFDYEYRLLGLPEPDKVIYLRVDPDVSQRLLSERYNNDESKKDVHEKDVEYLRRSGEAASYCAGKLGWDVVECVSHKQMRSIDDIFSDIVGFVQNAQILDNQFGL